MNEQKIYIITDKNGNERRTYHSPEEIEELNKRLPKHVEFIGTPVERKFHYQDSIKKDILLFISAVAIAIVSILTIDKPEIKTNEKSEEKQISKK